VTYDLKNNKVSTEEWFMRRVEGDTNIEKLVVDEDGDSDEDSDGDGDEDSDGDGDEDSDGDGDEE
jgi:hypothetical protein